MIISATGDASAQSNILIGRIVQGRKSMRVLTAVKIFFFIIDYLLSSCPKQRQEIAIHRTVIKMAVGIKGIGSAWDVLRFLASFPYSDVIRKNG